MITRSFNKIDLDLAVVEAEIYGVEITDNRILSRDLNSDMTIEGNGTGKVVLDDDSTVQGNLFVTKDLYFNNNALISNDTEGQWADRTSGNVDHIWHDDSTNRWNFCSDTDYKGLGNSELYAKQLYLTHDAVILGSTTFGVGGKTFRSNGPILGKQTLTIDGNTILGSTTSNSSTIRGTVTLSDSARLTTVKGTFNVIQASTLEDTLLVKLGTTLGNTNGVTNTVRGIVNISDTAKQTTVKGAFNVKQATVLDSTLSVLGDTTLGNASTDTSRIRGNVILSDNGINTKVAGTLGVDEKATFASVIDVKSGIVQNGITVLNGSDTWLRSTNDTGWYSATYDGGIYMTDTTWVKTFNDKGLQGRVLKSTVAQGTAPLQVTSTTKVANLNADLLDDLTSSQFLRSDVTDTYGDGDQTLYVQVKAGRTADTSSGTQSPLEVKQNTAGSDAFMAFHIGGDYATYFGLDGTTNDLFVGGWSKGANKHRIWHEGNMGSGSGLDADKLDGLQLGTGRNNGVNEVVRTQANGYAEFGWINTTSGDTTTASTDYYVNTGSDGYIRKKTLANVRTELLKVRTDYKGITDSRVVGQLMWKRYGNTHTIFDASHATDTTPTGTTKNNTNPENAWTEGYPTLMGFNGTSTYGVRVDSCRNADWANTVDVNTSPTHTSLFNIMWHSGDTVYGADGKLTIQPSSGNLKSSGTMDAVSFNATSDERKKKNIVTIDNASDMIKKIDGVYFDWKDDSVDSSRQAGVIAQTVEKVLPEAVSTDIDTDDKTVNYNAIIGLLIESNKELMKRIEVLEKGNV